MTHDTLLSKHLSHPIAQNAIYSLLHDDEGRLVLTLNEEVRGNLDIIALFRRLKDATATLSHPRILRLDTYIETNDGGYWIVADEPVCSLSSFLREHPRALVDERWKAAFISQLTECIDFMHRREAFAVELSMNSLLVTNTASANLRMLPPCHLFCNETKTLIWNSTKDFLAPELLQPNGIVDRRTDIFGLGYIIGALYPMGDMPYPYRCAWKIAIRQKPENRFPTIGEMTRYIDKQKKYSWVHSALITISIILAVGCLLLWSYTKEEVSTKSAPEYKEHKSDMYIDSLKNGDKLMQEVEAYLHDTTYMMNDTAYSLSEPIKSLQREGMRKAEQLFETEFRRKALPLVMLIYTPEMLNSDEATYIENAKKQSILLQELQVNLAKEYQIEPSTATRICAGVLQELADQCTKK